MNEERKQLIIRVQALQDQLFAACKDRLNNLERIAEKGIESKEDSDLAQGVCTMVACYFHLQMAGEMMDQ